MSFRIEIQSLTLNFKFEAGTSRGVMRTRDTWILKIFNASGKEKAGFGECAPLFGLSEEPEKDFSRELNELVAEFNQNNFTQETDLMHFVENSVPSNLPSVRFGMETAIMDLMNGGKRLLYESSFTRGNEGIFINGLIWMGNKVFMIRQINDKVKDKFRVIKLKVGADDFVNECEVLEYIREQYYEEKLIIKLDANGAFRPDEALKKLEILSGFDLHSIEQPIAPGQQQEMARLCRESPLPIALDEELIGVHEKSAREDLLNTIKPSYIILKPTLLGGFKATREWIDIAEQLQIGWWITSALESNLGLNAIAQFTAVQPGASENVQGLGTGSLYFNNLESPLLVRNNKLFYNPHKEWTL
jgi:o-succinylbenzoate synthase